MAEKSEEPAKYPEIAARLAQFIKESGEPNARQFAKQAKLAPQKVSYILQGKFMPGAETLVALATAYRSFDAIWLLTGRRTLPVAEPDVTSRLAKPATQSDAVSVAASEPQGFGADVEVTVLRRLLADRDEQLERKDEKIAELNQRLGKPFNGLDAAGALNTSTPRNPIGFGAHKLALSVSNRVKNKGAARPL